jgi:uncharacterized protein (TIGR03118 family)
MGIKKLVTVLGICAMWALPVMAASSARAATGTYVQTNLVSDGATPATTTDPNLLNSWGITSFPGGPFWIADNGSGLSTLYDGLGNIIPLVINIPDPTASKPNGGTPTGIVAQTNPTLFLIPGTTDSALFIFATEDGTIAAWNNVLDLLNAHIVVDNSQGGSSTGAVYKGLALGNNASGSFLYATNFRSGKIDVFDSSFKPATLTGSFNDPNLPAGAAPFGIANIRGNLIVTYAKQDAAKHDDVAGAGLGWVDIFDTNGNLIETLAKRGSLNAPWGIAEAPFNFGRFSNAILIGNFGDGRINAYNPITRMFVGQLSDSSKHPIMIDGLWALSFGGAQGSDPGTLYFTAGPNSEADGLFGSLTPQ